MPDGEIRYGIYNGTTDVAQSDLFDTPDEAWDAWGSRNMFGDFEEGSGDPVLVATDYGGGWMWEATATRDQLTSNFEPYEIEGYEERPFPLWATYPPPIRT
jgi:hypothetical protein